MFTVSASLSVGIDRFFRWVYVVNMLQRHCMCYRAAAYVAAPLQLPLFPRVPEERVDKERGGDMPVVQNARVLKPLARQNTMPSSQA